MIVDIMEEKDLDIFDKMIKCIDELERRAILTESKVKSLEKKVNNQVSNSSLQLKTTEFSCSKK